jgi:sigma-B regulation protein RsbU (phosphoserine phosphatase)
MQITPTDVLHAFRNDEPYLFIGAASVTVGLAVVGFLLIRRRFDRLLSFFAWFAILYGERVWLTPSVLWLMEPPSLSRARFERH